MSKQFESLLQAFLLSAQANREANAVWVEGQYSTYGALQQRAANIAAVIARSATENTGGQCAVFAYRSTTAYAAVLAAQMAGMAYVPLNPKFPPARNLRMLEASDSSVVVIDAKCLAQAGKVLKLCARRLTVILPDSESKPAWAQDSIHELILGHECHGISPPRYRPSAQDTAYILFTSGSTGVPKGVEITQGNACAYLMNAMSLWAPTAADRFTQMFDLTFDLSVHDMFVCWAAGGCLYCVPDTAMLSVDTFVRDHDVTFWFSVPSIAALLRQYDRLKACSLPTLRYSLFCGEALPSDLAEQWSAAAHNSMVENLYGPTEATIAITSYRYSPTRESSPKSVVVPIGRPFPGQEGVVLDVDQRIVPPGNIGELYLGGSQVSPGYWHNPEITDQRFFPFSLPGFASTRWYKTGDLVSWNDDFGLAFHGRGDDQVKIGGFRVELEEVESVIRRVTGSKLVAAIAWPIGEQGEVKGIIAFVVDLPLPASDVIRLCTNELPQYMIPKEIHNLPVLPLNSNGKLDRAALQDIRRKMQ